MAQKQSTSLWVWAFLLLMLGSFVVFVLFLDQQIIEQGDTPKPREEKAAVETKPIIDFYDILPKREHEIVITDEEREAIENPSINKEVVGQAILQVGSFQSAADAESRKAELAFLGLEAKVQSAVVSEQTWHRVQLGPFASETSLSRAKNLLIENQIQYMQRNLD